MINNLIFIYHVMYNVSKKNCIHLDSKIHKDKIVIDCQCMTH